MSANPLIKRCISNPHVESFVRWHDRGKRHYASVQSSDSASQSNPTFKIDLPKLNGHGPFAEKATFDVIGSPFSLLNARIPSKAVLFTRRGSLIGLNGNARSIGSTLSVFNSGVQSTLTSALVGAPFLYQKLQANEPFTALIGTKATATSFAVLELDGRFDWNVITKNALLAWCGVTAQTRQTGIGKALSRTSTNVSGRGTAVVCGNGQIYQIVLQESDSYILNPSNVLAYTESCPEPQQVQVGSVQVSLPERLPALSAFLLKYEFFRVMAAQSAWKLTKRAYLGLGRFMRHLVWGNQLLVRFQGPTTILVQSRTTTNYVEERGPVEVDPVPDTQNSDVQSSPDKTYSGSLKLASVENGKVVLHDTKSFVK